MRIRHKLPIKHVLRAIVAKYDFQNGGHHGSRSLDGPHASYEGFDAPALHTQQRQCLSNAVVRRITGDKLQVPLLPLAGLARMASNACTRIVN